MAKSATSTFLYVEVMSKRPTIFNYKVTDSVPMLESRHVKTHYNTASLINTEGGGGFTRQKLNLKK